MKGNDPLHVVINGEYMSRHRGYPLCSNPLTHDLRHAPSILL